MERKFTRISYVSLLFSFIPIILFYLIAEGVIKFDFVYALLASVILSFILSITALIKKSENKLIPVIALFLTIVGGLLVFTGYIVSGAFTV